MRISTAMLFQSATQAILDRQSDLLRTQQQLSTGRRILSPSDDPVAAAQAVGYQVALDVTTQHAANVSSAKASLSLAESALGDVNAMLQSARELVVQAGDASLSDADRRALATDLQARLDELVASANRRDGQGRYLFAGFQETTQPFVAAGATVAYAGDAGVRSLDVSASRALATSAPGSAIFQGIASGNGKFVTANGAGNAGDGSISVGSVTNAAALTGHAYDIAFAVGGGATTYTVTDTTSGTVLAAGQPYAAGSAIVFDGQQVAVLGSPASGDRFTVAPAGTQDIFSSLSAIVTALRTPQSTAAARGDFRTAQERALADIDQGSERMLEVRSGFGASLRELDALEDIHAGLQLHDETELSRLTSLDYASAVSDFTREQQALEAAQKAFKGTTQSSLFDLL